MEEMYKTGAREYLSNFFFDREDLGDNLIMEIMEKCDAVWIHDGDNSRPHAELTGGECSNGFFNCLKALKYVNVNELFAYHLAKKIRKEIGDLKVDWVIGSPMAGIVFSHAVARYIGAPIHMFTEKDSKVKGRMFWQREIIPEGDSVLQIEELITKATTLKSVQEAINRDNPYPVNWIPVIGTLVHRPKKLPFKLRRAKSNFSF